jgi:hypothetical protein
MGACLRGRLHVYDSPYDSVHDLLPKGLGFWFSIIHLLQPFVNTFAKKMDPKFYSNPPLTPNRTPNRTPIRTRIRTCRRPLMLDLLRHLFRPQDAVTPHVSPKKMLEKDAGQEIKHFACDCSGLATKTRQLNFGCWNFRDSGLKKRYTLSTLNVGLKLWPRTTIHECNQAGIYRQMSVQSRFVYFLRQKGLLKRAPLAEKSRSADDIFSPMKLKPLVLEHVITCALFLLSPSFLYLTPTFLRRQK